MKDLNLEWHDGKVLVGSELLIGPGITAKSSVSVIANQFLSDVLGQDVDSPALQTYFFGFNEL